NELLTPSARELNVTAPYWAARVIGWLTLTASLKLPKPVPSAPLTTTVVLSGAAAMAALTVAKALVPIVPVTVPGCVGLASTVVPLASPAQRVSAYTVAPTASVVVAATLLTDGVPLSVATA